MTNEQPISQHSSSSRAATPIDGIADEYLAGVCALDPGAATYYGVPGGEQDLPDYSPAGWEQHAVLARRTLAALNGQQPVDDVDRVTVEAMRERLGVQLELHDSGLLPNQLNVIASPVQELRQIFDLMPTSTAQDWENVAARLSKLPEAAEQVLQQLRTGVRAGQVSARRQVEACIAQCQDFARGDGFFAALVGGATVDGGAPPESLAADLATGLQRAQQAYTALAAGLAQDVLPHAPQRDAVGRDAYAVWSRYFLGAAVDLDETYSWGLEELARIAAEQEEVASAITGRPDLEAAIAALEADPARRLLGTDALRAWMQEVSDRAVAELAGTHFDIPEPVRRLECMIAPTSSGGIYYTGPTDDFSRPGRMWWAVPEDVTEFNTWRETTTVYHEGVPGHHLQIAQTVYRRDQLNRWRRLMAGSSGHAEGWALYAERLMADLGYLDDPGDRLGMLDGQRLRAARVALDIGVHLELPAPDSLGGGRWNAENAWTFLNSNCSMAEGFLRFELDRYLGWPGQAPSYKVGERLWLDIREQVRGADDGAFDLVSFHRRALDLGSMGLDTLRTALLA